ncbi:hypothetical protein NliqN6_5051 [Naganishia liquefaciens]|uniref:RRM domain-containing protein n=1 Tax=Naganishia liquefaciens TaxID=104408 RepID=A0A8H3TX11_9TREE|nr:hypothetical protein NliqN6_5051 [Naganishia liquefaciens]
MSYQYTPEEQAAAWAAYYAANGYPTDATASASYSAPVASSSNSGIVYPTAPIPDSYDTDLAQQASAYQYHDPSDPNAGYMGPDGKWVHGPAGQRSKGKAKGPGAGKRETVIRKAGGKVWEDQTLLEWDPAWFRLFVGDLSNDVNDNTLNAAFAKYPSYIKCKVVRDRLSDKAKYGFIAFTDPEDFLKAWKEMDGKYVGNRPIRLMKVNEKQHGGIRKVNIGNRKAKELDKLAKNKGKPLNGRPTPW